MTGERLLIFRLADRLGKTIQEFMEGTTHSELLEWSFYLDITQREHTRQDYIGAVIAREVFLQDMKPQARNETGLEPFLVQVSTLEEKQEREKAQRDAQIKMDIANSIAILRANQKSSSNPKPKVQKLRRQRRPTHKAKPRQ